MVCKILKQQIFVLQFFPPNRQKYAVDFTTQSNFAMLTFFKMDKSHVFIALYHTRCRVLVSRDTTIYPFLFFGWF